MKSKEPNHKGTITSGKLVETHLMEFVPFVENTIPRINVVDIFVPLPLATFPVIQTHAQNNPQSAGFFA